MEKHAAQDAVILIPSLEPDDRLPAYIRRLKEGGFARIVVVDDGSSESYQPIFREIESVDDTTVLHLYAFFREGKSLGEIILEAAKLAVPAACKPDPGEGGEEKEEA